MRRLIAEIDKVLLKKNGANLGLFIPGYWSMFLRGFEFELEEVDFMGQKIIEVYLVCDPVSDQVGAEETKPQAPENHR